MEYSLHEKNTFHEYRQKYKPRGPSVLNNCHIRAKTEKTKIDEQIKGIFSSLCQQDPELVTFESIPQDHKKIQGPLRIGCVLSGG
mmetsp:Transcript_11455/g.9864  ORF Transcript_11455/g.9864 Transcript_11455/m.9864 type:complete len:85 (-) Transcript_11455:2836-3090(-)